MPVSMTGETHCYENAQAERDTEAGIRTWRDFQNEGRGAVSDTRDGLPVQHPATPCRLGIYDTGGAVPANGGLKVPAYFRT